MAGEGRDPSSTTLRIKAPDGSWRWCEAHSRRGINPDSNEHEIHASIRDISKYKQIEKAIERVAKEWRSTFDAARDAIIMLDRHARVIRVNLATTRLLDADFADLLGQPLKLLVRDRLQLDDPFGIEETWARTGPIRKDVQLPGSDRWLRSNLDPVMTSDEKKVTGAILFLSDISKEKQAENRLRETLGHVRKLSSHLHSAREEERKSIAREVHDELGHALTALKMDISWLVRKISEKDASLSERAQGMSQLIDQTISTVRRISTALHPPVLDDLGLDAALDWLARDYQDRTDIKTVLELPEHPEQIRSSRASAVFRIVQEALTNVARHAQATEVRVSWSQDDDHIVVSVVDNGQGFDSEPHRKRSGFGLLSMSERARDIGGQLELKSKPKQGTRLRLTFPRKSGS
jgi:two-component system, NarL family, sensor histidine kinase UhpB